MKKQSSYRKKSSLKAKVFDISCFLIVVTIISIVLLFFTNKDFANELRQVKQSKPNHFLIGVDTSLTIKPDILQDFKEALILRLKKFIGEKKVSYGISVFGVPGCGEEAIVNIVSSKSPQDVDSFSSDVEKKIKRISLAARKKRADSSLPLTTPLHCFLEKILEENRGERILIISDLVNDDSGCRTKYLFPVEAVKQFGENKDGQIIFFYPTPYLKGRFDTPEINKRLIDKQKDFIRTMMRFRDMGKVRVFFYKIPDDPEKRLTFFQSQLQNSIPATFIEVAWERISKLVKTVVGAIRG